jgi:subtilisin inhibitor-like
MKVLALALVALASVPVAAAMPSGDTSLRITVVPNSAKPRLHRHSYTLRCGPPGGTLPHPARACSKLAAIENPFAPLPPDVACTDIYGGPRRAVVVGLYRGRSIYATFTRIDGCQISRWDRVRFLFPAS